MGFLPLLLSPLFITDPFGSVFSFVCFFFAFHTHKTLFTVLQVLCKATFFCQDALSHVSQMFDSHITYPFTSDSQTVPICVVTELG